MAEDNKIKISQLQHINNVTDNDVLIVNDAETGKTRKTTKQELLSELTQEVNSLTKNISDSGDDVIVKQDMHVNNDISLDGDLFTTGKLTFGQLHDYANNISALGFADTEQSFLQGGNYLVTAEVIRDYISKNSAEILANQIDSDTVIGWVDSANGSLLARIGSNEQGILTLSGQINALANSMSGLTTNLVELTDVNVNNPSDNDVLGYDPSTQKWVNREVTTTSDGENGTSPAFVKLEPITGQVIRYGKDGVTETDTLEFKAITENYEGEQTTFEFFVDGASKGVVTNNLDSARFTLADGDEPVYDESKNIKVTAIAGSDKEANDYVTVYGIKDGVDGIDAVTAFLTNEVHTEPADSAGVLTGDLTDAGGFLKVFVGVADVTGDNQLTYSKGTELGISSSIDGTGEYTINSFNSVQTDRGSVELNVAVPQSLIPNADSGVTVTKKYSIAKLIGGSGRNGADGSNSRAVKVLPLNGQVIRYDEDGEELDELQFRAVPENITGSVSYRWKIKNSTQTDAAFDLPAALLQDASSTDFTLPDNEEPSVNQVRVVLCEMYETDSQGNEIEVAQDIVSVYGLSNGFAITGFLTNETHVEPADSAGALLIVLDDQGNPTHLDDAGGQFKVYLGTTDITSDLTADNFAITNNSGMSVLMNFNNVPGQYRLQSFDENSTAKGSATLQATVPSSIIPTSEEDVVIEKQFSVAKSFRGSSGPPGQSAGDAGLDARAVKLEPVNGQVYRYGEDGQPVAGQSFRFNVVDQQGFDAAITYKFFVKDGPGATRELIKPASGTTSDAFVELSGESQLPNIGSSSIISVEAYEGTDYTTVVARDFASMYGLADGVAITAFLTNESHTEPFLRDPANPSQTLSAPKDGSYSTAGGNFKVFRGVTEITSSCSFSVDTDNSSGGTFAIDANGEYSVTALEQTAFISSAVFEVTVPNNLVANADADLIIDKRYSISKSVDGIDGSSNIVADLSNENHSITAQQDGTAYNYDGATTTFSVYEGDDDITPAANAITRVKVPATGTNSGNVDDNFAYDISADGRTITVTHMGKNVNTATVTFTAQGRSTTFTLTKVKDGENGEPATVYRLLTSASVIRANPENTVHTPATITFTQQRVIGNGTPLIGDYGEIEYYVTNNGVEGSKQTITAFEGTYTLQDGDTQIRAEQIVSGSIVVDQETIPVIFDGEGSESTPGERGPGRFYIGVSTLPTTATQAQTRWNDGTYVDAKPSEQIGGDQAIFYLGTIDAQTAQNAWIYNGTTWVEQTEFIDGNLLVAGSVTADRFVTSATADGQTIVTPNVIQIFSGSGATRTLRVKLGNLSVGELDVNGE